MKDSRTVAAAGSVGSRLEYATVNKNTRRCTIEGCERKHYGHGWCSMHYQRWAKRGDPLTPRYAPKVPVEVRFWGKVNKTETCWVWTDAPGSHGYGVFGFDGSQQLAHRVSYQWKNGPIPDGLHIDHTCHNEDTSCPGGKLCKHRMCVRPSHLEPVTPGENSRRGQAGKWQTDKTHCPYGHEYTPENTRLKQGRRYCKTCLNKQAKEYKSRKKAERRKNGLDRHGRTNYDAYYPGSGHQFHCGCAYDRGLHHSTSDHHELGRGNCVHQVRP